MQAVSIRRKSYVSSFEIGDPAALNNQTKHPYGSQRPSLENHLPETARGCHCHRTGGVHAMNRLYVRAIRRSLVQSALTLDVVG
jgi:hypothetical protein